MSLQSMTPLLRITALPFLALALSIASLPGCAADDDAASASGTTEDEPLTSVTDSEVDAAQRTSLDGYRYESLTPTGAKIMKSSLWWMTKQDGDARYPKPRMCASNVSKVLFLSGLRAIDQEGVRVLLDQVEESGGRALKLPQNEAGFVAKLNTLANGTVPAGTLVAGLNVNTSAPGDQHIGFIGHTDPDGTVWIYHNNWYRPANENGARKPFMVSDANLRRGFERQFMATPWVKLTRNSAGQITRAKSLLPAIDDMDPFNPSFQVTLAVIPEIRAELGQGGGTTTPGAGFAARRCEVSSADGIGNVRAEERSSSQLLASLRNGTAITAKSKRGDWYSVEYPGGSGFMHHSVLTKAPCGANPPANP